MGAVVVRDEKASERDIVDRGDARMNMSREKDRKPGQ